MYRRVAHTRRHSRSSRTTERYVGRNLVSGTLGPFNPPADELGGCLCAVTRYIVWDGLATPAQSRVGSLLFLVLITVPTLVPHASLYLVPGGRGVSEITGAHWPSQCLLARTNGCVVPRRRQRPGDSKDWDGILPSGNARVTRGWKLDLTGPLFGWTSSLRTRWGNRDWDLELWRGATRSWLRSQSTSKRDQRTAELLQRGSLNVHSVVMLKFDREIYRQVVIGVVCNLLIIDCGLHEGWSTTTLPKFDGEDPTITLNPDQGVLVVNLMYVGVGIGSLAPIVLMDRIGRKWTLLVAAVPKVFSWVALGLASNYAVLYFARLLAGVGCGITYSVMPMYLGEISSKRTRGPLGTLMAVLINSGILLIYAVGLYVSRFTMAMISLAVPLLFIVTFVWLPESSVFLTRKNRLHHAERTLKWSLGKDNVEAELEEIKRIVSSEEEAGGNMSFLGSLRESCRTPGNRRTFGIAMILLSALTLTGATPILTYQSYIYKEAGFEIGTNLSIVATGCAIVLAGITCVSLVRSVGKRLLLLFSAPLCVLSLGTIATFFTLAANGVDVSRANWIPTVFVVIYIIVYGLALNPVPLAYVGEIFAFDVKIPAGVCCALYYAVTTNVTVKFYQVLSDSYGIQAPFWAFTFITLVLWILIYLYVPETEGKTLEEIQNELHGRPNDAKYVDKKKIQII